ncbi:hypothetical protein [Chondromyces apiculatus]|uniref:Uncharacterized protein n=1 Tax=Chondromyces apiculatus DSM 436 TaxID=1192034 RepID=A0A017TAU7_9BACT|nr:hypothetical protein [Chondromyces apiculatus]EYF06022.1 Hypothetical protein CAP_2482 [Chondromyces apiculatus DSM 436]
MTRSPRPRSPRLVALGLLLGAAALGACSSIIGLDDLELVPGPRPDDGPTAAGGHGGHGGETATTAPGSGAGGAGGAPGQGGAGGAGGFGGAGGAAGGGGTGPECSPPGPGCCDPNGDGIGSSACCDADNDGFLSTECIEAVPDNTDCDDTRPQVRPNQTAWFDAPYGGNKFDYNCSGATEPEYPQTSCASPNCPGSTRNNTFLGAVVCGHSGRFGSCSVFLGCSESVTEAAKILRCH